MTLINSVARLIVLPGEIEILTPVNDIMSFQMSEKGYRKSVRFLRHAWEPMGKSNPMNKCHIR